MRIGIVVCVQQSSGGIFQYTQSILSALHAWETHHEFIIFVWQGNPLPWAQFSGPRWQVQAMDPAISTRAQDLQSCLSTDGIDLARCGVNARARHFFESLGIDLLIFPAPAALAFECGIPYFIAIHDLQHRLQPEFPEVSNGGTWQRREYLFRNSVRFARGVLVDSEVGKEDVLAFYGANIAPRHVHVLPFLPAHNTANGHEAQTRVAVVRQKHGLPERFFFYPAQFWLHKNHARLIHSIHRLRTVNGVDAPLVLAGSNSGGPPEEARQLVFQNVLRLARQLGVQDLVHYLGYVPDADMPVLYLLATALVMPTFFGPTNIPVLEAWTFGCPVLTSDIRGIREQVGGAGVLVDPRNVTAMTEGMLKLWKDEALRASCIESGTQRLAAHGPREFSQRLLAAIAPDIPVSPSATGQVTAPERSPYFEGLQFLQQSRWSEALQCLEQAARVNPKKQGLHFLRAQCLSRLGRRTEAAEAVRAELQILPSHPDALRLLAELQPA